MVLVPNNRFTGEEFRVSVGVFLQSMPRSTRNGSCSDFTAFAKRFLAVFTTFLAFPFDGGYAGELVTCSKP